MKIKTDFVSSKGASGEVYLEKLTEEDLRKIYELLAKEEKEKE